MAQIFPKWTNHVPRKLLIGLILTVNVIIFGIWYYFSPEFTDVGYAPKQPVPYSHQIHVQKLGLDCQYCHTSVWVSKQANVPPTQTCMNCHSQIKTDSEKLAPIRESWETGEAVEWVRVHNLADYAYFNHAAHVNVGVGCESCHGRIDQMEVVYQAEPLSMSWCMDCHRNPEQYLRPIEEVTTMGYKAENQLLLGAELVKKNNVSPPQYCQGCHY
ncbi:MAG: cytochrome C [Balneola sp.]|nr:cytochrome C [Balneola sp.]|tara:strand:- start:6642 stop:7286 length:645 start_codon:yes stop_codon:yes gene_type:complete